MEELLLKSVKNITRLTMGMLIVFLLVFTGFNTHLPTHQVDASTYSPSSAPLKIKVKDKHIPQEASQQAQAQFSSYAQALSQIDQTQTHNQFELGQPFKIYKLNGQEDGNYYFPIKKGNQIAYILTVTPKYSKDVDHPTQYSVRISRFISSALNQSQTSHQPITIYTDENGYYIEQNHQLRLALRTTLPDKTHNNAVPKSPEIPMAQTVDPTTTTNNTQNVSTQYVNLLPHFKVREQQGNNGWCAGYVMAALMNATGNTSKYQGEAIMHTLHPNMAPQQFQMTGLTIDEMIQYGKSQGKQPVYSEGMPNYNTIDQTISQNKGIAILGQQVEETGGIHVGHSMAVVGTAILSNQQHVIVIWNPWDQDYTLQPADSNIIPVSNGNHYEWFGSVIGY